MRTFGSGGSSGPARVDLSDTPQGIRRDIIRMAWPIMLTNVIQSLTILVDMIMVGQLSGDEGTLGLAAIGLGGQIFFIAIATMIALGTGTIALMSRSMGKGQHQYVRHVMHQSLLLALLFSIPFILAGVFLSGSLSALPTDNADIIDIASDYVTIVYVSTPFVFFSFMAVAAHQGVKDSRTPLAIGILVNMSNVILNYLFIYGFFGWTGFGARGVALGTAYAYMVGAVVYFCLFTVRRHRLRFPESGPMFDLSAIKRLLRVSIHAISEQWVTQIGILIYYFMVFSFGGAVSAAHPIGIRIFSFMTIPGVAFSIAVSSLVGFDLGRKKPARAERITITATRMTLVIMIAIAGGITLFARPIAALFIDDKLVVGLAVRWLRLIALGIPAIGVFYILAGAQRGAGDTKWPLLITLAGLYIFRIPLAVGLGFYTSLGYYGIWASLPIEFSARAIMIWLRFSKGKWKNVRV